MSALADLAAAIVIAGAALWGVLSGTDVFEAMLDGIKDGLGVLLRIFPSLVALLTAVYMLRASGALEALTALLSPLLTLLGIPPETAPLMLLRPVSGSGALAAATELIGQYGPDSYIDRPVRPGLLHRPHRRRHARLHRDHLLCHRRLLRRRGHKAHPLGRPRRPLRRYHGLRRFRPGRPPALGELRL